MHKTLTVRSLIVTGANSLKDIVKMEVSRVIYAILLSIPPAFCQLQCPNTVIGTSSERAHNVSGQSTAARIYLNLGNPAVCHGSVTSLNYCHYPTEGEAGVAYSTLIGIYRLVSNNYKLIPGSERLVTVNSAEGFNCSSAILSAPVQIEPNDTVGVCVARADGDPVTRSQLNLVGQKNATDHSVYGMNVGSCNHSSPTSISIDHLQLMPSMILHLSANITSVSGPATLLMTDTTQWMEDSTESMLASTGAKEETIGVAVGVAFAVLFVVVMVTLTMLLVTVLVCKKKQTQISFAKHETTKASREGIENLIYGLEDAEVSLSTGRYPHPALPDVVSDAATQNGELSPYQAMAPSRIKTLDISGTHSSSSIMSTAFTMPSNAKGTPGTAIYEGMPFGGDIYSDLFDETQYSELIDKNKVEDIYGSVDQFQKPASKENEIYRQLHTWGIINLSSSDIEIVGHLGSGHFGRVERGVWRRQGTRPVDVALKSLTKISEEDKVKFLQEAAIMAQFRHPNVIMLYGVIAKDDPMTIVVELAEQGDLREYLLSLRQSFMTKDSDKSLVDPDKKVPTLEMPEKFLKFSQQVALGMQYLSGKGFIHRDLAARNVLITGNNICKVADFGMSRDLEDETYYVSQGGKIPVKWTAPEALYYKRYSTASDVWSYGCLLYEIWSLGCKPYEAAQLSEIIELVDSGKRLGPPPGIPKMIYELMILCWHPETVFRPSFRDIVITLNGSKEKVLNIPEEDSSTNPLAGVLGAPLEAGENMYSELQKRYVDYSSRKVTDDDYFEID